MSSSWIKQALHQVHLLPPNPTSKPTAIPTAGPTAAPTSQPTSRPTDKPSDSPSVSSAPSNFGLSSISGNVKEDVEP